MSYLGFPRLNFVGTFQANPSTVNNDTAHFDNDTFENHFQRQSKGAQDGWWNPDGTGGFALADCYVTTVLDPKGHETDPSVWGFPPEKVPDQGILLISNRESNDAKIVDLDPDQQGVSELWGMDLTLCEAVGRGQDPVPICTGTYRTAAFDDIWVRYPPEQSDGKFGVFYQSVIEEVQWFSGSQYAALLQGYFGAGPLSIKFNLDGFHMDDFDAEDFTFGRVVGSIGPYTPTEPRHFLMGRRLRAVGDPRVYDTPCRVDEDLGVLFLDWGNSFQTAALGGPPVDLGPLDLVYKTDGGFQQAARLPKIDDAFYRKYAGIAAVGVPPHVMEELRKSVLAVQTTAGQLLLSENDQATYVRADTFVYRMSPGDTADVDFYATRYGRPYQGAKIEVTDGGHPAVLAKGQAVQRRAGIARVGTGSDGHSVSFVSPVTTGPDGRATSRMTANDPVGHPRPVDGQVELLNYGIEGDSSTWVEQVSVLVWSRSQVKAPAWLFDVQPILQQYANLYPYMRKFVGIDLSDYSAVTGPGMRRLTDRMSRPTTSPDYMPVTRDLSPARREMILGWLRTSPGQPAFLRPAEAWDVPYLQDVLQVALELELSTLPPYLCALFSLRNRGSKVARIIDSVAMQEMLHMALAGNVLIAVGGRPRIGSQGFVPKYPGHLPGGIRPDLTVRLRRCSKEQVRDVFMSIERPDKPINMDEVRAHMATITRGPVPPEATTAEARGRARREHAQALRDFFTTARYETFSIGWFYTQIANAMLAMEDAGQDLFTGDPAWQLSWPGGQAPGELFPVTDMSSALAAISEIVVQGEGTPTDPDDNTGELAHFYRFGQIVDGFELTYDEQQKKWVKGAAIPFDPVRDVFPMRDDPDTYTLPDGSGAQRVALEFDATYVKLLQRLGTAFNGRPDDLFEAVALMSDLNASARTTMTEKTPGDPSTVIGPSFQWPGEK
ncbi:ferritin-like protein [Streptomyces sp. B1866]|uniref:ferritin-like domain-containing protein n=1 Tax=Streptomyces sp. B1866 TaxID=3075431 RepID=UPI0028909CF3|nr:ferritin-like protein [Streptomyces sp. B1866]MDT3397603.1 ferritin-like protein [Streptomyces sp. B1866]